MSVTIDVKVLVYASNKADAKHHAAQELLEGLAAGPDLVYLFWPTVMGYLRLTTHPAILPRPLTFRAAADNISQLLHRPHIGLSGRPVASGRPSSRLQAGLSVGT